MRIWSLRTSRLARFQSMECHDTFRDVDERTISAMQDVICFLILKDSPHSLAIHPVGYHVSQSPL